MGDDAETIGEGVDDVNRGPADPPPDPDWVTQAEAARLRGVSRQAISKLVEKGRFRTRTVGGRTFVRRVDLDPGAAAPPPSAEAEAVLRDVRGLSDAAREEVFRWLLARHNVHPVEAEFGADAEVILEAIGRSSDISKRGVRGLLAEAFFKIHVLDGDVRLTDRSTADEAAFDFLVRRAGRDYRVEVKLARRKAGELMLPPKSVSTGLPRGDYGVVEIQRTRGGRTSDGRDTRPYRTDAFDVLAVSLHPATGNWADFRFVRTGLLTTRKGKPDLLNKMHPVPIAPALGWRASLHECLDDIDDSSGAGGVPSP